MEDLFGLVGHAIEGRYAVDAVVAAGGFGVVYHATHTALGAPVAVKVLKTPDTLPEHLRGAYAEQFRAEAKIIAALQHPAIVRVLDYGVLAFANGYQAPWMALEWIDGATLAKDLDARRGAGGRSPRECLELLTPVLEALALAHAKGIAHRDIKPANLMIPALDPAFASVQGARVSRSAAPRLRLLDFGIAKVLSEGDGPASGQTYTASAMAAYSPRYAAPEQASGTRTGPWTDVHALGLVLTELLVDAAPYPADKGELHIATMADRRPTPAKFGVDVGAWEPVLVRALALRPAERYANAAELLAALEAVVPEARPLVAAAHTEPVPGLARPPVVEPATSSTTAPITAPAPTPPSRPSRWPFAALALLGVAALATGAVLARRANGGSAPVVAARPASTPPPPAPAPSAATAPVAAPATPAASAPAAALTVPVAPATSPAAPSPAATAPTARAGRPGRVRGGRVRPASAGGAEPSAWVAPTAPAAAPPDRNRPW
ncbi:MAG: serine/threonine-protein kinase [Polyangiales bacterium]